MKQQLKENYVRFFGNFSEHDGMGRKKVRAELNENNDYDGTKIAKMIINTANEYIRDEIDLSLFLKQMRDHIDTLKHEAGIKDGR